MAWRSCHLSTSIPRRASSASSRKVRPRPAQRYSGRTWPSSICRIKEYNWLSVGWLNSGRGNARAGGAHGTPTQIHISPNVLVHEEKVFCTTKLETVRLHHVSRPLQDFGSLDETSFLKRKSRNPKKLFEATSAILEVGGGQVVPE